MKGLTKMKTVLFMLEEKEGSLRTHAEKLEVRAKDLVLKTQQLRDRADALNTVELKWRIQEAEKRGAVGWDENGDGKVIAWVMKNGKKVPATT